MKIYNTEEELVRNLIDSQLPVGAYSTQWNGTNNQGAMVANGLYIVAFSYPGGFRTGKVMVQK